MQKFFSVFISLTLVSLLCTCGSKSARENIGKTESKNKKSIEFPVTQKLMGLDETIDTQWVSNIPHDTQLTVLTGQIGMTGNAPFLNVALYINDQDSYLLAGNQRLMDYLTGQHHEKLTVAGEIYHSDKQKWIKVMYVKTN